MTKSFPALTRLLEVAPHCVRGMSLQEVEQAERELKAAEELLAAATEISGASINHVVGMGLCDRLLAAIAACERKP